MTERTVSLGDALTKDELRALSARSTMRAAGSVALNWALIATGFAIPILWTNPLTILLGIALIASRILGLGILVHDCAHNALFKDTRTNEFVGRWICGAPIDLSLTAYRDYHLKHHKYAGTPDDPDIIFIDKYPVPADSLRRKFIRDLTGQTGVRDTARRLKDFKLSEKAPWLVFHAALLSILTTLGAPWAYLLWWAGEIFGFPFIARLRQIGEHGVAPNRASRDPRDNTNTTRASWWERIFIAPNNVHYHLEHHQFASVPPYNLSKLHRLLTARGYYDNHACITDGYFNVIKRAVQANNQTAQAR